MQTMQIVVKIPKNIAIQTLVDVVCCTEELSENVVDLVSVVVISWVFVIDELCKRKKNKREILTYCRKYCMQTGIENQQLKLK